MPIIGSDYLEHRVEKDPGASSMYPCHHEHKRGKGTCIRPEQCSHIHIILKPMPGFTFSSNVNLGEINFSVSHMSNETLMLAPHGCLRITLGAQMLLSPCSSWQQGQMRQFCTGFFTVNYLYYYETWIVMGFLYPHPPDSYWMPTLQYLKMWPYLEIGLLKSND